MARANPAKTRSPAPVTVAFVFEWMALETLILTQPKERVTDALLRLEQLVKHWPLEIAHNYDTGLRAADLEASRQKWREAIASMYLERKEIFHGREFHVPVDPFALPSWEHGAKTFGQLEAILGRCVAFVAKRLHCSTTLADVWVGVEDYQPDYDDCPPTNLGGWSRSWGVRET